MRQIILKKSRKCYEMSEKRFVNVRVFVNDNIEIMLEDKENDCLYDAVSPLVERLLNYLDVEMKKLKEENEQLKEQLQMIERIIQTQIAEREEDLQISVKRGMPTGGLYSEIGFLEELKKECFDE